MRASVLLLLALLPLATTALAHLADDNGFYSAEADGLAVVLDPNFVVPKAGRETVFNGSVFSNASGPYHLMRNATVQVDVTGPADASAATKPRTDGFQTRITFPASGEWRVIVHVNDTDATRAVPVHVYPSSNVRIESSLSGNFHYVQKPVRETLFFLDDATSLVVKTDTPATGRVERYGIGNASAPEFVTLKPAGTQGGLLFERTFTEEGWYVLSVASPGHGIGFDDLPPIKFHVQPPFTGSGNSETPAAKAPAVGVLGALGVVVAAAVLARKRRT
jgi:hypothetical protein